MPERLSRECWHHPERTKTCILCWDIKPLGEFYAYEYTTKQGKRSTRYESRCKPCAMARRRAQFAVDPDRFNAVSASWREKNPDRVKEYRRERQADPVVKAKKAFHQRVRGARMRAAVEDSAEIRAIYAEAVRIEAIIRDCPVFDIPELGKKIHVDHKQPLARGGKHEPSNLQLLPGGINLRKWAHA